MATMLMSCGGFFRGLRCLACGVWDSDEDWKTQHKGCQQACAGYSPTGHINSSRKWILSNPYRNCRTNLLQHKENENRAFAVTPFAVTLEGFAVIWWS